VSDFELKWHGDDFLEFAGKINKSAMRAAALEVEREAKLSFGKGASMPFLRFGASSTGATIRKTKSGKRHRVSAPGFPPNVNLGILKSSVAHKIIGISQGLSNRSKIVEGFVGNDIVKIAQKLRKRKRKIRNMRRAVEYGFYLEVGTKNMQPRPWLRPALLKASPEILKIFRKANS
jgi:hypothetical protein